MTRSHGETRRWWQHSGAQRLAKVLANVALWLSPDLRLPNMTDPSAAEERQHNIPARLNFNVFGQPGGAVRRRALDPVWCDRPKQAGETMIPLREHVKRLCVAAEEHSRWMSSAGWRAVSENLHLTASLSDMSADTDLSSDSFWCGPAADFQDADSDVAEKHLAGIIVFNLVWTAYECSVEIASKPFSMKQPKGARGRDLLVQLFENKQFPHLHRAVHDAFDVRNGPGANFRTPEMRRMIATGSMVGIGAEHLREFRNAVVHGNVTKPVPEDWGINSTYDANNDPAIRQFHFNIRITLILIQILMRSTFAHGDDLSGWLRDSYPAALVLTQLHCAVPEYYEPELPFDDAPLLRDKQ